MEGKPKLLIFGGTVFIGKTFLDHLKVSHQDYDIYCLNRGSVYWYLPFYLGMTPSKRNILTLSTSTAIAKTHRPSGKHSSRSTRS
jgi:hypothetical protein